LYAENGGRPLGPDETSTISAEEVHRIREGLSRGLIMRPHPCLHIGTRVQVREGVFAGVQGIVGEIREECKVILSAASVNYCFSLEVELRNLTVLT
jgi:transcription antitermination factor NusG